MPFKAQSGVLIEDALKNKLLNIEGIAIDTSVNANKWQVPEEDLDFFTATLQNAQLRVDHAESALMIVGKVGEAKRVGTQVLYRAEVGEEKLIEKILRNYVTHVSAQVDSEDVECSKCKRPSRKEGMLIHLCPGAWEIVHKPKVRELSIVASPAYENTVFKPVGFGAAMNESQHDAILTSCAQCSCSKLLESNKNVGSKRELQEPENKQNETREVKPMSTPQTGEQADKKASPHQAQGIVNVAPGEQAPKQVTYEEMMTRLTQVENKLRETPSASDAEVEALTKKVAELEADLAKRATKRNLSKKIADLGKKLADQGIGAEETREEGEQEGKVPTIPKGENEAKRATGQGIVAIEEVRKDALGNMDWFKDLCKARTELVGFK
jgi:hypothetical protein